MNHYLKSFVMLCMLIALSGCATIKIGTDYQQALTERTLQAGNTEKKVAMIALSGVINDVASPGLLGSAPSLLDRFMMQLKKAEEDKQVVAVIIKMNTPGGSVTTSDVIYYELEAFKKRTGKKVFIQMMDVAASGGYYIAMAADHIQAHPTTLTASVGVVTILPNIEGLMDKVGVEVKIYKSGEHKDTNSPFRRPNAEDQKLVQGFIDKIADKFHHLVQSTRQLDAQTMQQVKTAQVYLGEDALKMGLIDSVGYLSEATELACQLAEKKGCALVSYGYSENPNATSYSVSAPSLAKTPSINVMELGMLEPAMKLKPGSYYLYLP